MSHNITTVSKSVNLVNEIYDTFTKKEQMFVTGGDDRPWYVRQQEYDKEGFVVYSSVTLDGSTPVSFLDVFSVDGVGEISLGVRKSERGKGFAKNEVKKLLLWYDKNKDSLDVLSWCVNRKNEASVSLAESFGFQRDRDRDFDSNWIAYRYVSFFA